MVKVSKREESKESGAYPGVFFIIMSCALVKFVFHSVWTMNAVRKEVVDNVGPSGKFPGKH